MKRLIYFVIPLLLFSSCVDDRPLKTYNMNDIITMEVPADMEKVDAGIVQNQERYLKGSKDFPVEVGISMIKKSDLQSYGVPFTLEEVYQLYSEDIGISFEEFKLEKPKSNRVDFMEGLSGLMSGKHDNKSYILMVIVCDAPFYFYKYYAIAEEKSFKKYKALINDMLFSVEEYRDFEAQNAGVN